MNATASAMTGIRGERVALCDVQIAAVLEEPLAEVAVCQTYRNDEAVNIEAVYTFPLPVDAVLLELDVHIGGRVLTGKLVEKKTAERQYEDAVEAGDAAVMLESIEPGLYTMNVGNLLPGETVRVNFRYALLHRWDTDRLRLLLPTTIAPRYGASRFAPHQVPEVSLAVENEFSLSVRVRGALRDAQFACPSHRVELERTAEEVVISLREVRAVMDRDFVLNIKAPRAERSSVVCGQDGEGFAALASFRPFFGGMRQPRPLNLVVVVDCSGSMAGESMAQARRALEGILDGLEPQDRIALVAFGSVSRVLARHPLPCEPANLDRARAFARALDADMGGTEIGTALREAYAVLGRSEAADLLLITDGEVGPWQEVVEEARRSGHRLFTVGVGHAVSEAFLRALAEGTGGQCELVSPGEGMAERIVRHFERMRSPRARRVSIRWPEGACDLSPERFAALFEGDTLVASARFPALPAEGAVALEIETQDGTTLRETLALPAPAAVDTGPQSVSTVARVAAASRLEGLDADRGLATALAYGLISPWTHWLVVAARPEEQKPADLPALRTVPQTLAAGWGGIGGVALAPSAPGGDWGVVHESYRGPMDFLEVDDASSSGEPERRRTRGPVGGAPAPALSRAWSDSRPPRAAAESEDPDDLAARYAAVARLWTLLAAEPRRLALEQAPALLVEAGVVENLDELARLAALLGLDSDAFSVALLVRLLDMTPQLALSAATEHALDTLRKRARQARKTLDARAHCPAGTEGERRLRVLFEGLAASTA